MIPFRRILFAVDHSEACLGVVPYVKAMVRQFSSELTLVQAFGNSLEEGDGGSGPFLISAIEEAEQFQLALLKEFAASNFSHMNVHSVAKFADPASAIGQEVRHGGIDLVMLATHGQGAFRRMLLGSVTAKVLHDVDCAVWTGTHEALTEHQPDVSCKSIVCALGLTEESEAVLRAGASLANTCGASLHIVHYVETPPPPFQMDFAPSSADMIEDAKIVLGKLLTDTGVEATINVDSGLASQVVRAQARAHNADLVVTGRGNSQGRAASVWSSLYSIVRDAPCPVLSI